MTDNGLDWEESVAFISKYLFKWQLTTEAIVAKIKNYELAEGRKKIRRERTREMVMRKIELKETVKLQNREMEFTV